MGPDYRTFPSAAGRGDIDTPIKRLLAWPWRHAVEAKFFTERLGGLASMALNGPPDPRAGGPHRRG